MKGKIMNIGTLDTRKITEDVANSIEKITNVGTLITNELATSLMSSIEKTNIGDVIKVEGDVDIVSVNGKLELDRDYLEGVTNYAIISCNGHMVVNNDVTAGLIKEKILKGSVNGTIVAPSSLKGLISGVLKINGKILSYPGDFDYRGARVSMDGDYLIGYFGGRKMAAKTVILLEDIDVTDLTEVIDKIYVMSKLIITKRNLKMLRPYIDASSAEVKVFDQTVYYIEDDIELTEAIIKAAKGKKIYVAGQVKCQDNSVVMKLEKGMLEAEKVICENSMLNHLEIILEGMDVQVQTFDELPISNYGKLVIGKAYLESLQSKETKVIENFGVLTLEDTLTVEDLDELTFEIKNFGKVNAKVELRGALSQHVEVNCGVIISSDGSDEGDDEKEEHILYSNMGALTL